jgi:hypothetical protein
VLDMTLMWCQVVLDMRQMAWAEVIDEAALLLSELVGTDLIPEEFADQAARLASDLRDIAFEMRRA